MPDDSMSLEEVTAALEKLREVGVTRRTPTQAAYELGHDVGYRDALDHALLILKQVWRGSITLDTAEVDIQTSRDAVQKVLDERTRGTR